MIDVKQPVIVGFSNQMSPFEELWPTTHRALLPVVGKPIVIHTLERLRNLGHRHFRIADHLQQPFVRNRLGNGDEWGLALRYSDLSGTALLLETLSTFGQALYVNADELVMPVLNHQADQALETESEFAGIARPGYHSINTKSGNYVHQIFGKTEINRVNSPREYFEQCLLACGGSSAENTLPGSQLHRGAVVDWKTSIAPDVLVGNSCFVGKHCRLQRGAVLEENCILGNGVYMGKGARLANAIVMPNTYIGKDMVFENSVISFNGHVDLGGAFTRVDNDAVLGSTRNNNELVSGLPRKINTASIRQKG